MLLPFFTDTHSDYWLLITDPSVNIFSKLPQTQNVQNRNGNDNM